MLLCPPRVPPCTARKPARAEPGRYLLSGLVRCGACGRSMHGAFMKGKPYYRCNVARPDYARIDHPPTTAFREERILGALDEWLGRFTDEKHRQAALASLIDADREPEPEPADVESARRSLVQLQIELDRVMASLRAGMDPDMVTNTAKGIQREMAQAQARITTWEAAHPGSASIDEATIATALDHAGGLAALVTGSEREPRARLYRALGLDLLLDPVGDPPSIRARLQLCGGGGRI